MDSGTDAFRRAASRLVDGEPVDWNALSRRGSLEGGERRALRVVDAIRRAHDVPAAAEAGVPCEGEERLETGYEIFEEIGRGSVARVYRALDRALGREVALKVLEPHDASLAGAREPFLGEARALASIDHPNVVRIFAIDEARGRLRIALELIRGRTIERIVGDEGPLTERGAALVAIQVCRALAAVHERGLVHRDVKPTNVMRADATGRVVLLDFGIAVAPSHGFAAGAGPFAGTPLFMAPEQLEGRASTGPEADQFALGVLLHWMVSGEFPFEAATYAELQEAARAGRRKRPAAMRPALDPAFAAIVERLLAPEASGRFASAAAAGRALAEIAGAPRATFD